MNVNGGLSLHMLISNTRYSGRLATVKKHIIRAYKIREYQDAARARLDIDNSGS